MSGEFSAKCSEYAREIANPSTTGQAVFNARVPTNICFAVAIVDEVAPETRDAIQKTNPFDYSVDLLWYEVPVVCELNRKALYYFEKAANFFDHFKGEVVWKKLRTVIQQTLMP